MLKRVLSALLSAALLLSLAGCGVSAPTPAPTLEPTPEPTPAHAAYPYDHPLNILNDNYRNYYEIFVASFFDSDGDGMGDLNGVTGKLDYINDGNDATDTDLGFNGIWLMPVMPSPSYHKYDTTDYRAVDPAYGTLEDFQKLADACHTRGIKLILDFAFNHTSAQHFWFLEALRYYENLGEGETPDYAACPYAAYYHFSTEKAGAMDWYRAGNSAWYYEGSFWDQMPDLALDNPAVLKELESAASFWLGMGADGFRLDAVKEYVSGSLEANIEILRRFNDYVLSVDPDAYLVGEAWETVATGLAPYYKSGMKSFFNFPLAQATGNMASVVNRGDGQKLAALLTGSAEVYGASNPGFIDAPFLSNHDTSRLSAQYINDAAKMKLAAGILLTMSGSPFVYYGEELGMNSKGDRDENKRLPMHWSDTVLFGMPNPPPGADAVTQKFPALDVQQGDPLSIYNYYKRALRIRNESPEIARGETQIAEALTYGQVCAVKKNYGGGEILIVYNLGEAAEVSLAGTDYASYALYGYLTVGETPVSLEHETLSLPPCGIAVLR